MYGPGPYLYVIFIMIAWVLTFYTVNFYYLSYRSLHNRPHEKRTRQQIEISNNGSLPVVTIQLPIYNEKYVAGRLIDAVCKIDYPKDKLDIQVLDDSDDDTVNLIRSIVDDYKARGFDITHFHRTDRSGYKAGALKAGMKHAKGEFVAIFDADFIPPSWFLRRTIGHFADPKVGLLQCRWGHVNEDYSTLTEAQAISLDLHFMIEQKAKSLSHLFMNFNGTAGIWRTSCINDAGGWHTSTLVEDLDLSYRAQMKGWKCQFLEDIVVEAELPVQMNAAKRQQFRWAKGSMQVALKLLADVVIQRKTPADTKVQAFIQLTRHIVSPLFLAQFLIFPMLLGLDFKLYNVGLGPVIGIAVYVLMGPTTYLYMIRRIWGKDWKAKARQYLFLIFFATGMSVNNTVAVFDALFGKKNEFLRTPKFGIVNKDDDWKNKAYVLPFTKTTLLEIFFGIYGCIAIFVSILSGNPVYAPILIIQTIGFVYVAFLSIAHSSFKKKARKEALEEEISVSRSGEIIERAKNSPLYNNNGKHIRTRKRRLVPAAVMAFLILGGSLAFYGYYTSIYPVDKAMGYLARAQTAQTPQQAAQYLELAKELLPESGNPVWIFPTVRSDFGVIQVQLDNMLVRSYSLTLVEPHSMPYSTGLRDMHTSLFEMHEDLQKALPYLYVGIASILGSVVWLVGMLFMLSIIRKNERRERMKVLAR